MPLACESSTLSFPVTQTSSYGRMMIDKHAHPWRRPFNVKSSSGELEMYCYSTNSSGNCASVRNLAGDPLPLLLHHVTLGWHMGYGMPPYPALQCKRCVLTAEFSAHVTLVGDSKRRIKCAWNPNSSVFHQVAKFKFEPTRDTDRERNATVSRDPTVFSVALRPSPPGS